MINNMDRYLLFVLFIIIYQLLFTAILIEAQNNKIKLKDIQTLTLHSDRWTTARRGSPIRQLDCVGGGFCNRVDIPTAQCYNRGSDGRTIQWECKADMPYNFKFGRIDVSCEGYENPEDEYILAGSCGLQYTIEAQEGNPGPQQNRGSSMNNLNNLNNPRMTRKKKDDSSSFPFVPILIILAAIAFIYCTCLKGSNNNSNRVHHSPSGGDPSATGNFPFFSTLNQPNAPPPPPGFRTDFSENNPPYNPSFGFNPQSNAGNFSRTPKSRSSALPGILGGLAAGGLGGYLFGSNSANRTTRQDPFWGQTSNSLFTEPTNHFEETETCARFEEPSQPADFHESSGFSETTIR